MFVSIFSDELGLDATHAVPVICDGHDGRRSQSVLDAMYRSAHAHGGDWTALR